MDALPIASPSDVARTVRLRSLQIGTVRRVQIQGRSIATAFGKRVVDGPVALGLLGLAGDEQADTSVHGGRDKAVYAYPREHYPYWERLRREAGVAGGLDDGALPGGALGENLSLEGLLEHEVWVGDRLVFPAAELVVSEPRQPCYKFGAMMGWSQSARAMVQAACCGWYLRVLRPGVLAAGEEARLVPGARQVRIDEAFRRKMARRDV